MYRKTSLNIMTKFLETDFKWNQVKEKQFCHRLVDMNKI